MKPHWAADVFPLNEADVDRLAESIKEQGQLEPIRLTSDGLILDGRNRYLACKKAGVEPKTVTLPEMAEAELVDLAWALNGDRRDLSKSQRATAAAETMEAMKANGELKRTGRGHKKSFINEGHSETQEKVSDKFKVSVGMIQMARELLREDPEAFARVKAGKETVGAAHASMLILRNAAKAEAERNSLSALREKSPDLAERFEAGKIDREQAEAELERREAERRARELQVVEITSAIFVAFSAIHIVEEKMTNAGVTIAEVISARKPHQRKEDVRRYREVIPLLAKLETENLQS